MSQPSDPIFVKPRTYRRRRLVDATRVLPVIGLGLLIVPLLWPNGGVGTEQGAVPMSGAVIYIFGVWGVLILSAAFLARGLKRHGEVADGAEETAGTEAVRDAL